MTFKFNTRKATEAASLFIKKEGGTLNVMKLVKLIYLLDRLSIASRGIPVVGGVYFSMKNGPVTSELLDIINAGKLADDSDTSWERYISDRKGHEVTLQQEPPIEFLAEAEMQYEEWKRKTTSVYNPDNFKTAILEYSSSSVRGRYTCTA